MAAHTVMSNDELDNGQLKAVTVDDTELVVARIDGALYAVAGRCPHHQAPLADGLLHGRRLVCPWHQAVFDVTDGEVLEPPALDCLESYPVRVEDGDIVVELPDEPQGMHPPKTHDADRASDDRTFVIIGAGAAGLAAAQELRRIGYRGRLVLIDRDERAPFDRTNCSKDYLAGDAPREWMPLRPTEFFLHADVEQLRDTVTDFDVRERRIALPGGTVLEADRVLLCTGGRPRRLDVDGADLGGVFTLRSWTDADRIIEAAAEGSRAVIVGASFIGMEVASSLRQRGLEHVTVVAPEEVPFEPVFGREVGRMLADVHTEHGVDLRLGTGVSRFIGDGKVSGVELEGGDTVDADLVVVGIGVEPVTDYLSGVELRDDGSLDTDRHLQVVDGVFAAGDIATFPDPITGDPARIEHWRVALQHGQVAARNMMGRGTEYDLAPFFWTMQHGVVVEYVGHVSDWDEIVVDGSVADRDFVAYYVRDGRVLAASSVGRGGQINALHELLAQQRPPAAGDVGDGRDLTELLD
jgi:NADPH-dependent 2,4-dienoyl-CoA reductase/sulfur reductase-like enzyme/nitrite reductase/ring-hydroxylating ferredoxin subunit